MASPARLHRLLPLAAAAVTAAAAVACGPGRTAGPTRAVGPATTRTAGAAPACAPRRAAPAGRPDVREVLVLDGRVSDEVRPDAQAEAAQRRLAAMPVDSIVDLRFVDDSAGLAALGLCPADGGAMVVTTAAYARAHGLRPPPPALCVRAVDGRHPPRMAVPVGQAVRVAAGRLDILDECDRPAPPDVRWTSSKLAVLMVDGVGVARARRAART